MNGFIYGLPVRRRAQGITSFMTRTSTRPARYRKHVSWYRRHLIQQGLYEYKYHDTHQELYRRNSSDQEEVHGRQPRESSAHPGPSSLAQESSDGLGTPSTVEADADWSDLPELEPLVSADDLFEEGSVVNNTELDDIPELQAISDSDDSDNEEEDPLRNWPYEDDGDDAQIAERVRTVLTRCQPYPGDAGRGSADPSYAIGDQCFVVERQDRGLFCIYNQFQGFETNVHVSRLRWDAFSLGKWFAERSAENSELDEAWDRAYEHAHCWMTSRTWEV